METKSVLGNSPNRFILFVLSLLLICGILFTACPAEIKPPSSMANGDVIDTIKFKSTQNVVRFNRNQIILDPRLSPNAVDLEQALLQLGFTKRTCPCQDSLMIFSHSETINLIEVGTSVSSGPMVGGIDLFSEGLLLNTITSLDPFKESLLTDTSKPGFTEIDCVFPKNKVKIAIVDSGVDSITRISSNELLQSEWRSFNQGGLCYQNDFSRGVTYLLGNEAKEPDDHNGHGTSVNGVLSGTSYPNVLTPLPFDFVNVRFTQESTKDGTLFDALCASYYALNQNPHIINISWGIVQQVDARDSALIQMDRNIRKLFQDFLHQTSNRKVLVVAGIGNDSTHISDKYKFYPACLAAVNDNLISVGALNAESNRLSAYSNWSDTTEAYMTLAVRGDSLITAFPKYLQGRADATGYRIGWGTSYAAPLVSRIAGLLKAKNNGLSAIDLKNELTRCTNIVSDTISGIARTYRKLDIDQIVRENCR